jgi:hypothetical protein
MKDIKGKLKGLYNDCSKHSRYQNIPEFVRVELGYAEQINEEWRGDTARYRYILDSMEIPPGASVGDVGANTGFFTLSLAHRFKDSFFTAYEANPNHADFIRLVAEHFGLENVQVRETMVDLDGIARMDSHDTLLLLNVLHHAGYDFDGGIGKTVENFRAYAADYLGRLGGKTSALLFQMGSNWGGNKTNPIIGREDDTGKVLFASALFIETGWDIAKIALARRGEGGLIFYKNLPDEVVGMVKQTRGGTRAPELEDCVRTYGLSGFTGEFYRRPVFICYSKTARPGVNDR